jgi:AraC-like DNA-binding protein
LESQQLNKHRASLPPRVHVEQEPIAQQFALLCRHHDAGDNLQMRCLMLHLAATVLRDLLPKKEPLKPRWGLSAQDRFEALIREISSAEWQSLTNEELARRCGCSRRHFSRMFKQRFGCSLLAMQILLRIKRAQQLLLETDAKIIEVALDSGFQHVGLFVSTFKRHAGMTPSQWRKRSHIKKSAPRLRAIPMI